MSFSACSFKNSISLNKIVSNILIENGICKSKLVKLGNFENVEKLYDYNAYDLIEITDEELQNYVDDLLLIHEEKKKVTDRKIVQNGDAIIVSYTVSLDSEIVANAESDSLVVGSGYYGEEFENAVVGAVVGEPFICEIESPIDTEKYLKGEKLKYNITVESINYFVTYSSSDKYILDYYGFDNEEDFLYDCKMRIMRQKKNQNQKDADIDFLDALADKCKFYIDKDEVANYSLKIVEQYKDKAYINGFEIDDYIEKVINMTEDEFYDFCYDLGVNEIKRYLFVGAYTADYTDLSNDDSYVCFCSMNGYDSTMCDNLLAEYDFLKRKCIDEILSKNIYVYDIGYSIPFIKNKNYTINMYDSADIYGTNYNLDGDYVLSENFEQNIVHELEKLTFGETVYVFGNNFYDTILSFKLDNENVIKIMIDQKNGFVSMHYYNKKNNGYPYIVITKLTDELKNLIISAKS